MRRGHGSRLLNATVDHLREDGFATVVTWAFADDKPMVGVRRGPTFLGVLTPAGVHRALRASLR